MHRVSSAHLVYRPARGGGVLRTEDELHHFLGPTRGACGSTWTRSRPECGWACGRCGARPPVRGRSP